MDEKLQEMMRRELEKMQDDRTALYRHTVEAYRIMEKQAEPNKYDELLFEGSLTSVLHKVTASKAYHTPIRGLLESPPNDPCIEIYQRGNGSQPTIIRLFHAPPEEWSKIPLSGLTGPRGGATLSAEVEKRVTALEAQLALLKGVSLVEALLNMEQRLSRLERKRE